MAQPSGYPPISCGTRVKTTQKDVEASRTYDEPREGLKWGIEGEVIDYSDSHGLCYLVVHQDGKTRWYESTELEVVTQ